MMKIILLHCVYVWLYNIFMISSSEALTGQNIRYVIDGEFTFVVSIEEKYYEDGPYRHLCTGSLVSNRDVLTAEHCVRNRLVENLKVSLGSRNIIYTRHYRIRWWVTYDYWVLQNNLPKPYHRNDIAMIRLVRNVSSTIEPIQISETRSRFLVDRDVIVVGWGKREDIFRSRILETGILTIKDIEECRSRISRAIGQTYNLEYNFFCTFVQPYLLCEDGDSGSPILYYDKIVGITKAACPYPDEPPQPNKVNIHTSTYIYRNFIYDVIDNL